MWDKKVGSCVAQRGNTAAEIQTCAVRVDASKTHVLHKCQAFLSGVKLDEKEGVTMGHIQPLRVRRPSPPCTPPLVQTLAGHLKRTWRF
ncbi:hypothetical protein O3P69_001085 [Scylla paramamosain]|uniref:Uncharacterized protein n=1 Tax=Scylla paramamosain TaxID=85552 RepID=A0AAW0UPD1_SCYPA